MTNLYMIPLQNGHAGWLTTTDGDWTWSVWGRTWEGALTRLCADRAVSATIAARLLLARAW